MGQVIEFYRPVPKPPAVVPTVQEPGFAPADILRELLEKSETLQDIVVLMRDKDGVCGLVGNLDGVGENFVFMEQIKFEILARMNQPAGTRPTNGA